MIDRFCRIFLDSLLILTVECLLYRLMHYIVCKVYTAAFADGFLPGIHIIQNQFYYWYPFRVIWIVFDCILQMKWKTIQVSQNTGSILDSSNVTSLSDQCLASKGTINCGECTVPLKANVALTRNCSARLSNAQYSTHNQSNSYNNMRASSH